MPVAGVRSVEKWSDWSTNRASSTSTSSALSVSSVHTGSMQRSRVKPPPRTPRSCRAGGARRRRGRSKLQSTAACICLLSRVGRAVVPVLTSRIGGQGVRRADPPNVSRCEPLSARSPRAAGRRSRQIFVTAGIDAPSSTKSPSESAARLANSSTASSSSNGSSTRTRSPETPSGSRLVAKTVTPGLERTIAEATAAASARTCSQLSRTMRTRKWQARW